uniref:WW domain-containing protein n=1 Tax=Hyaloperonospora arabidopsidis (strain Emoy2) TaxID=559515 RepID=M4C3H5_HYAAE
MSKTHDDSPTVSLPDGWEHFTSPEGHPHYYNVKTKESRWELPSEENGEAVGGGPKSRRRSVRDKRRRQKSPLDKGELPIERRMDTKERKKTLKNQEVEVAAARAPSTVFQTLQASLEERLGAMHAGPYHATPTRQEGGTEMGGTKEVEMPLVVVEKQHEAETADMSAAERLRFLRKKRQESMTWKRKSLASDDFMAEVASNMKKKGATGIIKPEQGIGEKRVSWKEQEKAEEERKRQQMQEEKKAKEREAEKQRRQEQIAKEKEERREEAYAEQLDVEQLCDQAQKRTDDNSNKHDAEEVTDEKDNKRGERTAEHGSDLHETITNRQQKVQKHAPVLVESSVEQGEKISDTFSPNEDTRHDQSQGDECGGSATGDSVTQVKSVGDDHSLADGRPHSEIHTNANQDEKRCVRKERRAQKRREKELLDTSKVSSVTLETPRRRSTSSLNELDEKFSARLPSNEAEREAKAIEKQMRREKRRIARLQAAMAAQSLDGNGDHVKLQRAKHLEVHTDSSNDLKAGIAKTAVDSTSGQPVSEQPLPGQPLLGAGMYPPYPYTMMPPLLPPYSPYGYYYPFMPPPSVPMPMYSPDMVPSGYHSMLATPPQSTDAMAVPSALVPYGSESTLANAYGYDMTFNGMQSGPELSRCDCCKGIGVGLVEKNGVCAHCNRLRLAFIVDSAKMRLRCSLCGGWGFQLLQANGMCEHCTRQNAQKSLRRVSAATRHPRRVTPVVVPRRTMNENKAKIDDTDWDESSLDDSDWDD